MDPVCSPSLDEAIVDEVAEFGRRQQRRGLGARVADELAVGVGVGDEVPGGLRRRAKSAPPCSEAAITTAL